MTEALTPAQEMKLAFSTMVERVKLQPQLALGLAAAYLVLQFGIGYLLTIAFPLPPLEMAADQPPDAELIRQWLSQQMPVILLSIGISLLLGSMKVISYTMLAAGNFSFADILEGTFYRLKDMIPLMLAKWALVFFGLVCFIFPGLFLLVRFGFAEPETLMRRSSVSVALRESYNLTEGRGLSIFFLLALLSFPSLLVGGGSGVALVLSLVFMIIGELATLLLAGTLYFWWSLTRRMRQQTVH
jgi:hypothetical protein